MLAMAALYLTALPENLVLNIFFFLDVEGSDQW